ncbi:MAG: methyltransferase domain-containing protein [Candidatus Saliniplasma sp.]
MNILTNEEDAFGQCIYDYYKGENPFQIVERDDGYLDVIPVNHYFTKYEDWPEHQKEAMELAQGKVLDIGCGAGKHSIYLQKKGLDVIGIDISPLAITVCKERGLENVKVMGINQIHEQINDIETVLMLGNNFGLFESKKRAKNLLDKVDEATKDNAIIIAESQDPHDTDNRFHLQYHKKNLKKGRMPGQLRIRSRYKKYATPWFDYLIVSKEEMEKVLDNTNWKIERLITRDSKYYIAIIKKSLGKE